MHKIAVLLTVHNRKDSTLRCLDRIHSQKSIDDCRIDIYLTDDGCTDGTAEAVSVKYPDVKIIHGDGNLYWNRGMWTAWNEAAKIGYDYYLWLNDDTFVYPNMLEELLKASAPKKDKAIIVGATQSLDHKEITYGGRVRGNSIPQPNGSLENVDYFNGNIVLVPDSVYKVLGNLDYYFTHSKGDIDYGLRAAEAGIAMYQVGEIVGECNAHPTLDGWCHPDIPFKQRWKMLHRPNGMPPKETFHLERRHFGILKASFHYCTVYLRCLVPWLWD